MRQYVISDIHMKITLLYYMFTFPVHNHTRQYFITYSQANHIIILNPCDNIHYHIFTCKSHYYIKSMRQYSLSNILIFTCKSHYLYIITYLHFLCTITRNNVLYHIFTCRSHCYYISYYIFTFPVHNHMRQYFISHIHMQITLLHYKWGLMGILSKDFVKEYSYLIKFYTVFRCKL